MFGSFDNPFPEPRALAEVIRSADIIHVHQMNTYLLDVVTVLKRKTQILVVTDHGGGGYSVGRFFKFFNKVDAFTSHSAEMNQLSYRKYTNVWQLPIPINLPHLLRSEAVHKSATGSLKIVAVGRILPHKGFEVAIKALSDRDSLFIIGVIEDQAYYEWLLSVPTEGTVTFCHNVDDRQLAEAYLEADVFVSTSVLVDYRGNRHPKAELLSLVAIEAAFYGIPIIVSSISPALQGEIRAHQVPGEVYESGNILALRVCLDEWRWKRSRSASGTEYIQNHFGDSVVGALYHDFYRGLLDEKRKE
jgi:glycosyltransferase involved in cell wall biosynthesis